MLGKWGGYKPWHNPFIKHNVQGLHEMPGDIQSYKILLEMSTVFLRQLPEK
jgi:hypothetical protein